MKKNNHNKGFTLAEVLIVVALIGVLSGVAFISVVSYLRSMIQLERDGIAKEIFVAAQNHLTMVEHEGYLNQSSYGHPEGEGANTTENQDSIYYFVVNNGIDSSGSEVLKLMLPFGSVDETVRLGGSYIIRYQKNPGLILDVFYCTESGRFPHAFGTGEYGTVKGLAGEEQKAARRTCSSLGNSVIGWYGGAEERTLGTVEKLKAPLIDVINEDELYVKITNTNTSGISGKIKLIIQGEKSRAQGAVSLDMMDGKWIKPDPEDSNAVIVILDDITTEYNKFSNLGARLVKNKQGEFIPGENITIQAVAYNNDVITNIAYSAIKTTNSLYKDVVKVKGENNTAYKNTAYITSLRHLENLDASVSNLNESLKITAASQKTDLSWKSFLENIEELNSTSNPAVVYTCSEDSPPTVVSTSSTQVNTFKPVNLTSGMTYDGESHTISDIVIDITTNQKEISHAGLIEKLENGSISNLMLKDFSVSTIKGDAGALAGMLTETTIENVVARNTPKTDSEGEEGSTSGDPVPSGVSTSDDGNGNAGENAGGLVGSMAGGTMTYCASAICVEGKTTAGGLIGATAGGSVSLSYSGGHTKDGSYNKWIDDKNPYDVTGTTAGGLIGNAAGTNIDACYSTCSVSGTTAGGFVGSSSGDITNSYATGLVKGTTKGAFAGRIEDGVSLTDNTYYEIINEIKKDSEGEGTGTEGSSAEGYLPPIGSGSGTIEAFDTNAKTYNDFVGKSATTAKPYDSKLTEYYGETYFLKGIAVSTGEEDKFVTTHYGDWPAPEIFVINQ